MIRVRGLFNLLLAVAVVAGVWYLWKAKEEGKKPLSEIIKPCWEEFFPLHAGWEWRYQYVMNKKGETLSDRLITKVIEVKNNRAKVQSGWRTIEYVLKDDGVVKAKSGNYLIKEPIEKNASWEVRAGATKGKAFIKDVEAETTAGGKKYKNCLLIQEQYKVNDETLVLQAWYARDVGLIKLKSLSIKKDGTEHLELSAELVELHK